MRREGYRDKRAVGKKEAALQGGVRREKEDEGEGGREGGREGKENPPVVAHQDRGAHGVRCNGSSTGVLDASRQFPTKTSPRPPALEGQPVLGQT
jgi:hypothetical protein